jgi:hypothetical protein
MKRGLVGFVLLAAAWSVVAAGEIGYIETFALSRDRANTLKQLVPGTEDYYYYQALHLLQQQQFQQAEEVTKPWLQRYGLTQRLQEFQLRHALLTYDRDPQRSLQFLREKLGVHFNHEKEVLGAVPNLPTALDQQLISWERLKADSLNRWQNLDNFEDSALEWLADNNLSWQRRRNLLQRLSRPDITNLPKLVVDDLASPDTPAFGSHPIQRQMTQAQLDELLKLRADLLNQAAFVQTYIAKLHPNADEDWRRVPALTQAYFERLWGFVSKLNASHNSLKSNVLYHWLVFDRSQGRYELARFLEYLKLPRFQPYMAKAILESDESRRSPADLNADFQAVTMLPPIISDEPLVRSYLQHFFVEANALQQFEPYINDVYLKQLFAETKIVLGLGDPEQWASALPPEVFQQLKERVDIDFAFTNTPHYSGDEPVHLDVHLKNVPTLLVKVFEINTANFYREQQREVDTDINLDGLVANEEQTFTFTEPPLRRIDKRFEFPKLSKPGIYVVDFIGSGKSSRALIRKGRLRPIVTTGTAGQRVMVVDEKNKRITDATLLLGGQEYQPDKEGTIIVPFSTQPGSKPIILKRGDFACLDHLDHGSEEYRLVAGIHVERESLLNQRVATVLVRPGLFLHDAPISIKILENIKLRITSVDLEGISTSTEVPDFKLFEDRESTYEFRVPARLALLQISLQAQVKNLSQGKTVDLVDAASFSLNGIDQTDKIEDLHLAKFGNNYVIELLGKTGEPKPDRPVYLELKNKYFREPVRVTLKSDQLGRVNLGKLVDIDHLAARGPENTAHDWHLPLDAHTYRQLIHAKVGEAITLPYLGTAKEPKRSELALFELRGDVVKADRFDAVKLRDGLIEVTGLGAGDYDLWLKDQNERIRIRIVDGLVEDGYVLGSLRHLQLPGLKAVQIGAISTDADGDLVVQLQNTSQFTRVHVLATRYLPEYFAFNDLGKLRDSELRGTFPAWADSTYLTGRNIGDEFRYVLDRRLQKKFPGNMLERPQLLLNPWAVRSTETGEQIAGEGGVFAPRSEAKPSAPAPGMAGAGRGIGQGVGEVPITSNLDYLANAAAVISNLIPNKDGVVKLAKKDLGPHALIQVVAIDPLNTTSRWLSIPEQKASFYDLRLRNGLDPKAHFTQQKQVSILPAGQPFVLADIAASRFEAYDSLARVHLFYSTLTKEPKLAEFSFILNWPNLKPEEKRKQYSKYACHELSFFLSKKDPEFFRTIIKPYLANKKDKTFLDHWLLEDDLSEYLDPWRYGRLNITERVLLAQRLAGEAAKTSRHLSDLQRLQPPNLDRLMVLFDTAVKSGALETEDKLGLKGEVLQKFAESQVQLKSGQSRLDVQGLGGAGGAPNGQLNQPAKTPELAMRAAAGGKGKDAANADKSVLARRGLRDYDGKLGGEEEKLGETRGYFKADDRTLAALRQLYRRLEPTQEWAENNYYKLLINQQLADLVGINPFWVEYAQHDGKTPFLSKHFTEASHNFTEMMFALAVLDLPFAAGKHTTKFEGAKMTLTPANPIIAFHEEVKPAGEAKAKLPILISQNFYRVGDRFREEGGEKIDHFITEEFLVHQAYGCQVVVTNPTSSRQKLTVLVQLPIGAMPLSKGQATKTHLLDLEPYRTQTIDYLFYFPLPGKFAHFPVNVAKNEQYITSAEPFTFNVVEKPTKIDTQSWDYISQNGTPEQVLALLNRENVQTLNLEKIAFRMKDRNFFEAVTKALRERHSYNTTLWSYSIFHNSVGELREYLRYADNLVAMAGNGPLQSTLMTIDPITRNLYEHLEYKPLVNARAHSLGNKRQIVNERVLGQYHHFLKMLSYKRQLDDADLLAVTYYLLLQDRIEEALETFARVRPDQIATRMQYDYCAAYLAFFSDEPGPVRAIAAKYAEHPVDRWRNTFTTILNQLDEIEGKNAKVADADDRAQRQGELATQEPSFNFTLDARKINVTWQNVDAVRINYYLMDVELLFSRNPFVQQYGSQFSAIKPNQSQTVTLPKDQRKLEVPLPADLASRNVLVEINAAGKTHAQAYYANALELKLQENYGQLRVSDAASGKALAKVYVKVYARLADGQVKFHKDGYTDHRGKFDYASVSTPEKSPIAQFAILVLSEDRGAVIRETAPPAQ